MTDECAEILALAAALRPREFTQMIAYWRSDGFAASHWLAEWVSGSREPLLPVTAVQNAEGHDVAIHAGDAIDRELRDARRDYLQNLDDIKRLLRANAGLEAKYIVSIEKPSKERLEELEAVVSDAKSCLCGEIREVWQRQHRTPWRIKRGLGPCCYSAWTADGQPDVVQWLNQNRKEQATA